MFRLARHQASQLNGLTAVGVEDGTILRQISSMIARGNSENEGEHTMKSSLVASIAGVMLIAALACNATPASPDPGDPRAHPATRTPDGGGTGADR